MAVDKKDQPPAKPLAESLKKGVDGAGGTRPSKNSSKEASGHNK